MPALSPQSGPKRTLIRSQSRFYERPKEVLFDQDALLGEPTIAELLFGVHSGLGPTIVTVLPSSPLL
jgi:hypothetical protein